MSKRYIWSSLSLCCYTLFILIWCFASHTNVGVHQGVIGQGRIHGVRPPCHGVTLAGLREKKLALFFHSFFRDSCQKIVLFLRADKCFQMEPAQIQEGKLFRVPHKYFFYDWSSFSLVTMSMCEKSKVESLVLHSMHFLRIFCYKLKWCYGSKVCRKSLSYRKTTSQPMQVGISNHLWLFHVA
jgi:hypothetical protein